MNSLNHFLTSFIVLFILFKENITITEIVVFSLIFGVLLDLNQVVGKYLKKPANHRRTWVEEPFGFIFIGIPIGLILSTIKTDYLFMTLIPYGLHIIQDYLTIHEVSPFAPISNKIMNIGFFRSFPHASWYVGEEKGISENYFLILNIIIMLWVFFLFT